MKLLKTKSKTSGMLKKNSARYQHRGNKIEPKKLESIDFIKFIQERVDFADFTTEYNLSGSNTKIIKKKIKLNKFFCLCFAIIILILFALIITSTIFIYKSNLRESSSLTFTLSSTLNKKTSPIYSTKLSSFSTTSNIINSINDIYGSTTSLKTKFLKTKNITESQNLSNWSTKILKEISKNNLFQSTLNSATTSTIIISGSEVFTNTSFKKSTIKTTNKKNILNLTTFMIQNCPDGFSGFNCVDGKNFQISKK